MVNETQTTQHKQRNRIRIAIIIMVVIVAGIAAIRIWDSVRVQVPDLVGGSLTQVDELMVDEELPDALSTIMRNSKMSPSELSATAATNYTITVTSPGPGEVMWLWETLHITAEPMFTDENLNVEDVDYAAELQLAVQRYLKQYDEYNGVVKSYPYIRSRPFESFAPGEVTVYVDERLLKQETPSPNDERIAEEHLMLLADNLTSEFFYLSEGMFTQVKTVNFQFNESGLEFSFDFQSHESCYQENIPNVEVEDYTDIPAAYPCVKSVKKFEHSFVIPEGSLCKR